VRSAALQGCGDLRARAGTRIHETLFAELRERAFVDVATIALANRISIRDEPEPREILENRRLVRGADSLAIVILDPQEHRSVVTACHAPDVDGVDDVSEVEKAGRRRRVTGYDGAHYEAAFRTRRITVPAARGRTREPRRSRPHARPI